MTEDLFATSDAAESLSQSTNSPPIRGYQPLAALLRPADLDQYFGQEHILARDKPLRHAIENGSPHSMIFWGPPGVGKTTLAHVISNQVDADFVTLSAVTSGVKDIRRVVETAQQKKQSLGTNTVLFVDEVHRFNKAQQDGFLPFIEDGTFVFIGATTENPSFELNNALISRCKIYVLKPLSDEALSSILEVALARLDSIKLRNQQKTKLLDAADGDARRLINIIELAADMAGANKNISDDELSHLLSDGMRRFDKGGDQFYDQISALHKAVRGSNPDAALYWFVRMTDGGCDPIYIARRLVRMASEDIGNADPRALDISMNAWQAYERLGSPEGELSIAQAVIYLACAAKSNAVYSAYKTVSQDVKSAPSYEVPKHLRNAPTRLMKDLGHGEDYRYAHNESDHYAAGEQYLPTEIAERIYYQPSDQGVERKIGEKLAYLANLDRQACDKRAKKMRGDKE